METEPNPIKLFAQLYDQIQQPELPESSAMMLATSTPDGNPAVRVVLLKGFDEAGFVFYTNLESPKAKELHANPHAALCFYWEQIHYQVRIEGPVENVSAEEADAYFATRPRGSQVGAWASQQSSVLKNRKELLARYEEYKARFAGQEIARPPKWSGFRVIPQRMEFWRRGEDRLHYRTLYTRDPEGWTVRLLYP